MPKVGRPKFEFVEDEASIEEAIYYICNTALGERPMLPKFGSKLPDFIFAPNHVTNLSLMEFHLENDILMWEPRIMQVKVKVSERPTPGACEAHIRYTVRSSNSVFNLVYPFYVQGS